MRFSYDRVVAKLKCLEIVSCVIDDHIQVSEVLNLLLEVGNAFFANIIVRLSELCMNIVTRSEDDINKLICVGLLRAKDLTWFIFRPVNAEEPSFRIVSHSFEQPFGTFCCWCELLPVCIIALVVREYFLTHNTTVHFYEPRDVLNVCRVGFDFFVEEILYGEGECEPHVFQVHQVIRVKDVFLSHLR